METLIDNLTSFWAFFAYFIALVAFGVGFVASRYQKVGPNEVLIVSGRTTEYTDPDTDLTVRKNFRIFHGGGTFVVPIREKTHRMSVELMTLEIQTPEFYTKLGVPIVVDAIAQIKVRSDDAISTATAAEMFLSKTADEMNEIAHQMMQGHLRGVISTMPFEEIHANPEAFAQSVQRLTAAELANMGIQVVSFTIRAVKDPSGYLQALGRPQMAMIRRDAILGESASNRDAEVGKAIADREANVAASKAYEESELAKISAEIAIAEAKKLQQVRAEEYAAEVARASAARVATVVTEKLAVSRSERQLQIDVEELEVQRKERELVHTVRKPAEAERFRIEAVALGRQKELEVLAEARAQALRVEGMAEAAVIRAKGEAEAESLRALGLAEAEAMMKKADAWRNYGQAAVAEMFIEKLPEIANAVAAPLAKIDRITLFGNSGDAGLGRVTKGVTDVLAQIPGVAAMVRNLRLDQLADDLRNVEPAPEPIAAAAVIPPVPDRH